MNILVACNPFKGSLTSVEAGRIIARALKQCIPGVSVDQAPISDGGDGALDCLAAAAPSRRVRKTVPGPLGQPLSAEYLVFRDRPAAVVEMARASGLALLTRAQRNPMKATTLGTGMLIRAAIERGCREVIVGIGGSATTEGGMGAAAALGYRFLDARGRELFPNGENMARVRRLDASGVLPALAQTRIIAACDVTNPLLGRKGAAAMYAPQKGASPAQVAALEKGLKQLADTAAQTIGKDPRNAPGAGAAGGLGFGLMAFLNAELVSGIDMMIRATGLEERMRSASLLITGEGRMDAQSAHGKAPFGLLELANKHRVPAIAFCGAVQGEKELLKAGFKAVVPIPPGPISLEDAMAQAGPLLARAVIRSAGLIKICIESRV
jgi:glycerate kinase